jgi:hypothetical protein
MKKLLVLLGLLLAGPAFAQSTGQYGNFAPDFGAGTTISATTASASVTLTGQAVNDGDLLIYSPGTTLAFCKWGVGAQTATNAGVPIPPGTVQTFYKGNADTVACIMASGTATIQIMPGYGR